MKKEPYITPLLPTIPSTRGRPIKPALLKAVANRSTVFRPSGSLRKKNRLMTMLSPMANAEVTTESSSSPTERASSEVKKELMIKQGVTICSSRVLISPVPRSVSIRFFVTK